MAEVIYGSLFKNQKVQQDDSKEEIILCRSITNGSLRYVSKLTGREFYWSDYGSTCKVPIKELENLVKNSRIAEYIEPADKEAFGYRLRTIESEEIDEVLRQALNTKDYRMYSPANQMKVAKSTEHRTWGDFFRAVESTEYTQEVELRGGIGNKVIARYEEASPYGDIFV